MSPDNLRSARYRPCQCCGLYGWCRRLAQHAWRSRRWVCEDCIRSGPDDLRSARKALGLTQARLASLLGVTTSAVGNWEAGVRPVPPYLGYAVAWLQTRAGRALIRRTRSDSVHRPAQ
jgi:DNA-binding XRE family transcriptional regulator